MTCLAACHDSIVGCLGGVQTTLWHFMDNWKTFGGKPGFISGDHGGAADISSNIAKFVRQTTL